MRKASVLFVAVALAAVGLAACGGSSNNTSTTAAQTPTTTGGGGGGGGSTVDLSAPADGTLAFDQKSATAKAGNVTINFDNPAPLGHDVAIADSSGKQLAVTEIITGGSTSTSVNLQPGTYTFYCTVDGHKAAGMKGTLTVK